jgi:putative ABC transport system permease protein
VGVYHLQDNWRNKRISASIIGFPIGWWGDEQKTGILCLPNNISWRVFMGAGLMTVMIALITVILGATKAAIADPVKSL